ncbi:MAG TPA: kelch repeat-containing protein, partial [Elusimicrobiota bacterium]|nr:kelch repeat-containing protein [Elusimicrobiota bacterium]
MPFGKNAARFLALLALVAALPGRAGAVTSRYAHSATLLPNGNVLIAGGIDSGGTPVATTEIYNVATGATNSSPNMTVARSSHTATLLPNGLVLIAGGVDNAGAVKNSLELYDPRANTFTSIPATLSSARYNHTATLLADGTVLLAGGQNPVVGGAALSSCDIYVPSPTGGNGSVTACNSMGRARAGHSATLLHTGRVFVSGGYDPSTGGYIVSTEIYDPTATSWSPGPALIAQRAYHSSTQMANKTVLITGGNNGRNVAENYGFLNTTEIYTPFANSIAPGAAMQARKMFHTAVQGPNGPLEVDGGLGNITTSYFTPSLAFQNNSIITIGAPTVAPATGTVTGTGNLTVNLTFNLSVPVTGDIIQGTVQFSSASATEPDLVVYFKSAQASINGAFANSGQIQNETVNVTATPGQSLVLGTTVAITADDTATSVTAGSIATSNIHFPNAANANDPNSGTDGTMDANNGDAPRVIETARSNVRASAVFPLPAAEYQGLAGTVLVGQATIQSGTILLTGGANSTGYTITLTGGLASLTGNCTISTINNTPAMRCSNLNFANLTGNIAVTSGTITSPLTSDPAATTKCPATPTVGSPTSCLSGLQITGLTPQLLYVPSTVNLSNLTFATDIATVAIKTMAFGDAERYDESANSFTFGDPSVSGQFQHAAVLLPNGDKILSGGRTCTTGSPTCASLSPITGFVTLPVPSTDPSWSSQGSLNQPRANHTLTVLQDGHALAAGGTTATGVLSSSELYDPATKKWAFAGAMTTSRNLHTATLLTNGTVLAAGGFATLASTSELNSAEIYIPESQRWSPVGLMTSSRTFHSAVLMSTGNVLVTGGFGNNQYLSSAEIYVSTALRWMSAGSMSKARALHTSTVLQDGRVLVVGGVNLADGVLNSVDIYSPARNLWLPAAALNFARHSHTATLLPDGRVLVAGGDDGFGEIGEAEIYNPKTNAWTALPITTDGRNILVPRLKHTALLLPNGKVEIVGGVTAVGAAIDETENFDAAFSTWTYQGRSNAKRGFHTSALLHDGNMINAGGFDGTSYLANSEDQSFQYGLDVPGPSSRVPQIIAFDTGTVQNSAISGGNNALTISGARLKGVTDAAGGASASGNSDYHHPRIYLQRLDGSGGNGQSASSYVLDVTTLAYYSGGNSWTNEDSSITVILPNSDGLLPFGLYAVRVAANAQFSDAAVLQVGPKRPAGQPGVPQGTLVGSSSVTWTWTASSGNDFDGYSVYSATSGVFLGTAPARDNNGNLLASTSFIVQGLGTNSVSLIKVAPYNVSGDGPVSIATGAVNTIAADISGLTGTGASPTSINWSWNVVNGATGYNVFSASSGTLLAALGSAGFTETNLSTNTAYGIAVQAITGAGLGPLSANTTAFTLAAVPTVDPNTAMVNI